VLVLRLVVVLQVVVVLVVLLLVVVVMLLVLVLLLVVVLLLLLVHASAEAALRTAGTSGPKGAVIITWFRQGYTKGRSSGSSSDVQPFAATTTYLAWITPAVVCMRWLPPPTSFSLLSMFSSFKTRTGANTRGTASLVLLPIACSCATRSNPAVALAGQNCAAEGKCVAPPKAVECN
jgi:hypothetical protein